jgi:hypothetical protein
MAVRLLSCYDDEPYFDGENCYHEIPDSKVGSLFRFNRRNVICTTEPSDIDYLEGEEYMKLLISRSDALVLKYNTLRKEEQIKKKLKTDSTSKKDDDDCDDR